MLTSISAYNLPFDYIKKEEAYVKSMTLDSHKKLAQKLLHPNNMFYVVAGDAETQLATLENIGLGKPILVEN